MRNRPRSAIRALAVLPLANLSGDPEQQYFTDGMTDELINGLARVASIKVIARGSVMAYKGTRKTLREIGRELGVDVLVEGSVSRAGNRVRVRAQLARSTGETLWAESYERDLRDVLALQSDVARAIVEKIQARLAPGEKEKLAAARPVDPEAYQEYLRGRHAMDSYTIAGFREAEARFRRAIDIDPTYAPAWAGLADAYYGRSNLISAPNTEIPRARAAAEKALEHDPNLAEGHTSLGIVQMVYDWDWSGAEQSFDRAIMAKPNDANAHWWRGHVLVLRGRGDEGLAESRKTLELDPLSTWYTASHGWHLALAGRPEEGARFLREAVQLHPEEYILNLAQLACAYARAGRSSDAERLISKLLESRKVRFVPAGSLAMAYAGLKDHDRTLSWLEAALEDHSEALLFINADPLYDFVRDHPRFKAVVSRVGLSR